MNFSTTALCTYVRSVSPQMPLYRKSTDQQSLYFGHKSSQVKSANYLTDGRNDSTKSRCSEPCTGFTDARGFARFPAKSRGSGKSISLTYEVGIDHSFSSGFQENRILHHTAKQVFGNANLLRCFHHKNLGGFYEHQK